MRKINTSLWTLALLFLRMGFTAFGGPAAHIAMMEDEVIKRRKWIDGNRFLDMVGATNLIPGPNSTEMAIHIGLMQAGWRGAVVAGACFIIPAVMLTVFFAWLYMMSGSVPGMESFFYGIKPAVIIIIFSALWRLSKKAAKTYASYCIAGVVLFLCIIGLNPLLCLLSGGILGILLHFVNPAKGALCITAGCVAIGSMVITGARKCVGFAGGFWEQAALIAAYGSDSVSIVKIMLFFLKVGTILYGSGYVLIAFIEEELVIHHQWLTQQQLLDAIAVGQLTPGPVLSTSAFIGFLLMGFHGAVVAAISIFLPSFLFVGILPWLIDRLRSSKITSALLDGVNVSVVVLMAVVLYKLAWSLSWGWQSVCIVVLSGVCIFKWKINNALIILGAGILGWILFW